MLTSHERYIEGHKALFTASNEEELRIAALNVVDNVVENQSIWKELNHYKKNRVLLAEHRIFKQQSILSKILNMSPGDKIRRRDNLKKEIQKLSKIIRDKTKPNQLEDDQILLDTKNYELSLLENALGLNG